MVRSLSQLRAAAVVGFALAFAMVSPTASAKTQKELEDEILRGGSDSTQQPAVEQDSAEEANAAAQVDSSDVRRVEEAIVGPRRVPREHILVVQRKYIEKSGRHEIMPLLFGFQLADSFRRQVQWGFGYAYHLTEWFGIEVVHANVIQNYSTGMAQRIRNQLTLEIDRVEPVMSAGSTLQFTPLRSKAAGWTSTVHFEGFLMAGGGATRYETGVSPMAMGGLGFRVYLNRYAIFKTEFRNYTDFRNSKQNHRFNILTGASVLFGGVK